MTDLVAHLAALAGLHLSDEEQGRLRIQLESLQTLIDALPHSSETSAGREPPPIPLRDDEPGPTLPPAGVSAVMPAQSGAWLDSPPVREDAS